MIDTFTKIAPPSETQVRSNKNTPSLLRTRRRHWVMVLVLIFIALIPQHAMGGYSRGGAFIVPGYGARAWGMGGALVATGGDEAAVYWNPAFLACLQHECLGLSYVNLVPGTDAHQSLLAYARVIKASPAGDVDREIARHAAGLMYGNLSLKLADGQAYSENIVRLAYAYTPDYFISFGFAASVMISRSDIQEFDAKGSAVDFGLRLQLLDNLAFGFVARDAASRISYSDGHDETLHRRFTTALAYSLLERFRMESATVFAHGSVSRTTLGAEYNFFDSVVSLRGALSLLTAGEDRLIPHFGLGFKIRRLFIYYNADFDSQEAFEDTHRFSLSFQL
jgi:hypothetical protein